MTLKTEAINALADRIEACEEVEFSKAKPGMNPAFNMSAVRYPCGAPACMIGHNDAMHGRGDSRSTDIVFAGDLGITDDQADELCAPQRGHAHYMDPIDARGFITKAHAVAVLRYLANTGRVDWAHGATTDVWDDCSI